MPRYAIPCNAPGVLQIMCHSDEVKMIPIDMAPWHTPEVPIQRPSRSRGSHGSFVLRWVGPKLMKCHESCVFLVGAARRRLWKLAPVDSDTVVLTATVPSLEGWIVQSSTCPCSTRPPPKHGFNFLYEAASQIHLLYASICYIPSPKPT